MSDGEIDRKESTPTQLKTRSDWNGDPPPREWVYEGWLGYRLTLFTGHGGKGKSRLALQLAAAVASGTKRAVDTARTQRQGHTYCEGDARGRRGCPGAGGILGR